jgi:hypothetical protein
VCHRTVSGAPGRITLNCSASGFWKLLSAIIHRTVRCSTGLFGVPRRQRLARQRSTAKVNSEQCELRAQSQSRRQKAHWTVNRTYPVHHRTVRWPSCQKLQRSNPNGWVTWLAHRTVSGGAPDCPVRPSTVEFPNHHSSMHPSIHYSSFNTRAIHNTPRHKSKPPIESKSTIQL